LDAHRRIRHVVLSFADIDNDAKEREPRAATIFSSASSSAPMPVFLFELFARNY
jgi:hypothetical protein